MGNETDFFLTLSENKTLNTKRRVLIIMPKKQVRRKVKNKKHKLLKSKNASKKSVNKLLLLLLILIVIILTGQFLVKEIPISGKAIQTENNQNRIMNRIIIVQPISEMKVLPSGELPDNSGCWITAGNPYYDRDGNSYQGWARKKDC